MSSPAARMQRDVRQLAIQMLYQLDARGEQDRAEIEEATRSSPFERLIQDTAVELAWKAWAVREAADALSTELAPGWPAHRQPPVDRSIIRLAYYEMSGQDLPPAIAINEAVELAKAYGAEKSPTFINGVLDKIARRIERGRGEAAPEA